MIFYNSFSFYSYFSHHYACSISRDNFSSSSFFIFFLHHFYLKTKPITLPNSNSHQTSIVVPRQRRLISQSQRKFVWTTSRHVSMDKWQHEAQYPPSLLLATISCRLL